MRPRYLLSLPAYSASLACALALLSFAALAACSSESNAPATGSADAASEATAEPAEDAGGRDSAVKACTLSEKTGRKSCDDCLLKECCEAINACFSDKDCTALNECYVDCYKLGMNDAGQQCVKGCTTDHPNSVKAFEGMLTCQNDSCGKVCKQ